MSGLSITHAKFEVRGFNPYGDIGIWWTNFKGSRDPCHVPFYPLLTFEGGGRQGTSYELISSQTTPHRSISTLRLKMHYVCQFGVKCGKKGYPYWILTPNESVLSYQVPDVCAKFHQNRLKTVTVRARTDRQTDTHTERDRDDTRVILHCIICPMICYSNGTDY